MNPESLYQLTESQHQSYLNQPDHCSGDFFIENNYTESLTFLKQAPLRFWYNTQMGGYGTHCHSALEIVTPVLQKFTMIAGGATYQLEPGDIFIIPSGTLHSYPPPTGGARFIYTFKPDFLQSLSGFPYILSLLSRPILINNDTFETIYTEEIGWILQLAADYWQQTPLWNMKVYAGLASFFACFGNSCMDHANLETMDRQSVSECLNRLFEYVNAHFSEDISLEQAADITGYSKYHFTRIFKECTGQTFMEYLRSVRISKAEKLLLNKASSISAIAFSSGFSSLTTFNRVFKQMNGCSPSEYQNYYTPIKTV